MKIYNGRVNLATESTPTEDELRIAMMRFSVGKDIPLHLLDVVAERSSDETEYFDGEAASADFMLLSDHPIVAQEKMREAVAAVVADENILNDNFAVFALYNLLQEGHEPKLLGEDYYYAYYGTSTHEVPESTRGMSFDQAESHVRSMGAQLFTPEQYTKLQQSGSFDENSQCMLRAFPRAPIIHVGSRKGNDVYVQERSRDFNPGGVITNVGFRAVVRITTNLEEMVLP